MWRADKKSLRGEDNKEFKTEKEKRPSENSSVTTSRAARVRGVGAVDIALRRKPSRTLLQTVKCAELSFSQLFCKSLMNTFIYPARL